MSILIDIYSTLVIQINHYCLCIFNFLSLLVSGASCLLPFALVKRTQLERTFWTHRIQLFAIMVTMSYSPFNKHVKFHLKNSLISNLNLFMVSLYMGFFFTPEFSITLTSFLYYLFL